MSLIDIRDKVNIYASATLSIDDYASLSLLYQPLIGTKALGIYQMLYSLLDRQSLSADTFIFSNILDLMSTDSNEFDESRLRLEGIGLIETFKKNDIFVFLIKSPLTPAKFLQDTVFGTYLLSAVGQQLFDLLIARFKIEKFDRLGYDNVTAMFDDVFESVDIQTPNINGFILGRKNPTSVEIQNHNFDFDLFESNINEEFLPNGMTPQIRRAITKVSYIYGYDESDMEMLFNQSIGKDGYFDTKILDKKAATLNKHNNAASPSIKTKSTMTEDEVRSMNVIANTSMKEMLNKFWPDSPDTYLKTISALYDELADFDRGVLNILVFSILKKKGGNLPTASYFKKCAESWRNDGISTREAAWQYVRGLRPQSEASQPTRARGANVKGNEYSDSYKKILEKEMEEL